jgi:hypothetical protein
MKLAHVLESEADAGRAYQTAGACDGPPYFTASRFDFTDDDRLHGFTNDRVPVNGLCGAILYCDENGSHYAEGFLTKQELEQAWSMAIEMATLRLKMFTEGEWCDVDAMLEPK